jgi:hypothetical protein
MSKIKSLARAFETGTTLTATEITTNFGLQNPHEAVRQLRNKGYCIYTNPNGYRLGTPTKTMVSAISALFGAKPFLKA